MEIKRSFSLVLCCSLLASVLFFSYGTISRKLLAIQEDNNGQSKARVWGSHSNTAPSQAGHNPPQASNNGQSKAGLWGHHSNTAPSQAGHNPPQASNTGTVTQRALNRGKPVANCGRGRPYGSCFPRAKYPERSEFYNRGH
ncbi:uncharacterized protein LOC120211274 [Hibiscus syriacus]|uniref:uncharacterized protein LOC120211274 n=1 Tax=Hibiscus syriacus TaxID=106335 RepID=UPI001923D67E|nr:uncharacterized protein LOC120211274 [Hibiscus syriacus]